MLNENANENEDGILEFKIESPCLFTMNALADRFPLNTLVHSLFRAAGFDVPNGDTEAREFRLHPNSEIPGAPGSSDSHPWFIAFQFHEITDDSVSRRQW